MNQSGGKIGIKEYVALVTLVIGTKLADNTPAILYEKMDNAAWMSPIIIGISSIIPIYFLLKVLSLYPDKGLMEVFKHLCGKYIGYLIVLVLWLIGSFAIIIDSAIYTDIIGTMYFTKTPTLILYLILMGVSAYGAKKGLEQIGSVAWSVIFYIKITLFVALILSFKQGNIDYLFPFLGQGQWDILKESSLKLSLFAEFLYLGIIASNIKSFKYFRKGTWISLIMLTIELPVAIASFLILYDYEPLKLVNYPFHETIRYLSLGFLSNIETFFFPFWLISAFVRFSFYLYLSGMMFGWLFKIKNFEYVIPSLATLFIFLGMIPETPTFQIYHVRDNLLTLITPFYFFLPILLWVIAKLKGETKNDKSDR
ncbi:GerAB/ArcD/ProY family transporter [Neobacillus sp. D3-1R]|uniref:GerAB/ArcD/ProY family transporter n=1 Tax=Neobacillus sp. D3-1R TaxID=3445778 RepID=UPI003F9EEB21